MGRVMIEEAVVTVASQTIMATEKLPHQIKRRLPGAPNVSDEHAPPYCREGLRIYGFGDDLITHEVFLLDFYF